MAVAIGFARARHGRALAACVPSLAYARRCGGLAGSPSSNPVGLSARVVGFEHGQVSRPIVQLEGTGERVTASGGDVLGDRRPLLAFRQRIYVAKSEDGGDGFRVVSLEGGSGQLEGAGQQSTSLGSWARDGRHSMGSRGRALSQYGAITRGANNVGLYAWASRRERARARQRGHQLGEVHATE
eukprot:CAMPEP_0117517482 /NCGR_PEP_ID=MMETSP0784-20121206/31634_1 /TAXON_ID=39447 /ORGANISM="" /LENGTH=183 /DNA_ID=CAMNT_0005313363 /DNA_START=17 /DNA_END=568 /DNA_ORIENTATION=-